MSDRVQWTCPGCDCTFLIPIAANPTVCKHCKDKLAGTPNPPRQPPKKAPSGGMSAVTILFLLFNFVVAGLGMLYLLSMEDMIRTQRAYYIARQMVRTRDELQGEVLLSGLIGFGLFYLFGLCCLAAIKFLTSRR